MTDAGMLLVEVLYQLRSSIDALAQDQALAREGVVGESLAISIVDGLSSISEAINSMADKQAEFQRDVMSVLSDISRNIVRLPEHVDVLSEIERDVSLIADRYRPLGSDLSPDLDD